MPDSGGAGRWRGGLAARRSWRVLGHDASCTTCCERTVTAPPGLAGGRAGAPARIRIEMPDGEIRPVTAKGSFVAPAGSLVVLDVPGSGGFGPPADRDPALLRRDVLDGYVSETAAYQAAPGTRP